MGKQRHWFSEEVCSHLRFGSKKDQAGACLPDGGKKKKTLDRDASGRYELPEKKVGRYDVTEGGGGVCKKGQTGVEETWTSREEGPNRRRVLNTTTVGRMEKNGGGKGK